MRVRDGRIVIELIGVVRQRTADENADLRAGDRRGSNPGVRQRLPRQLQQDALLRIHLFGFTGRNTEHARVEAPDVIDDACGHMYKP